MLHNLKHFIEAFVNRVAGITLKESLREFLAFLFAQAANHLPTEEDNHLHGAGTNIGPRG